MWLSVANSWNVPSVRNLCKLEQNQIMKDQNDKPIFGVFIEFYNWCQGGSQCDGNIQEKKNKTNSASACSLE